MQRLIWGGDGTGYKLRLASENNLGARNSDAVVFDDSGKLGVGKDPLIEIDTNGTIMGHFRDSGGQVVDVMAAPLLAKGDGTTDDYAAITAAIAATPEGGVTFFPRPSASYGVSQPIVAQRNKTILGTHSPRWMYDGGARCGRCLGDDGRVATWSHQQGFHSRRLGGLQDHWRFGTCVVAGMASYTSGGGPKTFDDLDNAGAVSAIDTKIDNTVDVTAILSLSSSINEAHHAVQSYSPVLEYDGKPATSNSRDPETGQLTTEEVNFRQVINAALNNEVSGAILTAEDK